MSIVKDALYEQEYNCLTTDLEDGYPPDTTLELGSIMYVYNADTKVLDSVFKLVNPTSANIWYRIV